jgi:8-oxo-dGTP pyrophosphatase MutT (NUDIX family)
MPTRSSSVIVLDDEDQVLLVLREDARIWALPAGRLEPGETYEQAAVREAREETGYGIDLGRLVGEYWRPQLPRGGDRQRVFTGRVTGGDASEHDWEVLEVRWFPVDALPKTLFRFSREHIEDAIADPEAPVHREQRMPAFQAALLACFFVFRGLRNRIRRR